MTIAKFLLFGVLFGYIMLSDSADIQVCNCTSPSINSTNYLHFRKNDIHALNWSNNLTTFEFRPKKAMFTSENARAILSKSCVLCLGDSLTRRLCATLHAFSEGQIATPESLKVGYHNMRAYRKPYCMVYVWEELLSRLDLDIPSVNKLLMSNRDRKLFVIFSAGIHHFQGNHSYASLKHQNMTAEFPRYLSYMMNHHAWTKREGHVIWRTAPAVDEKMSHPINLATWASSSVDIIYNYSDSNQLHSSQSDVSYFTYNSTTTSNTTSNTTPKLKKLKKPSLHILDHYSHVERVSYGSCRDKGDWLSHFGERAR